MYDETVAISTVEDIELAIKTWNKASGISSDRELLKDVLSASLRGFHFGYGVHADLRLQICRAIWIKNCGYSRWPDGPFYFRETRQAAFQEARGARAEDQTAATTQITERPKSMNPVSISPFITHGKMEVVIDRLIALALVRGDETVMQLAARLHELWKESGEGLHDLQRTGLEQQLKASLELIGASPERMRRERT